MKFPAHLFDWPTRHNVHIALPLFLLLSFFLHAAGVVIFQISYPRPHSSPPRAAQVYFLQPGSQEARLIEPMLAASDPALFSPAEGFSRQNGKDLDTGYVASFDAEQPSLAPLPTATRRNTPGNLLALQNPLATPRPAASPRPGLNTVVKLGGALSGRTLTPPADVAFASTTRPSLSPIEFLVAVSAEGKPLYIFQQSPAGDENLDRTAYTYLARSTFSTAPDGSQPAWGTATFLWGKDVQQHREP